MWRRWGQPTGNEHYTSGFEEEFERARLRHHATGSPEMWLFFKEVEPALQQDPGDQLRRVLLFRQRCEADKQVFYKTFQSTEDWTATFRQHLHRYIARLFNGSTMGSFAESPKGATRTDAGHPDSAGGRSSKPTLHSLAGVLSEIANGADAASHAATDAGLNSARLYLLGLSMLAQSGASSGFADIHEINTLYRLREHFSPLEIERDLLRRTRLADEADLKPGWYWFPQDGRSQLNLIFLSAIADTDPSVRRRALALLSAGKVRREEWLDDLLADDIAGSQPVEVEEFFWGYLEAIVEKQDIGRLEALRESARTPERVERLLLVARAKVEPGIVLAEMAASPLEPGQRVLDELSVRIDTIDSAVLVAAFASRHVSLRHAIAIELHRRGRLDDIREAAQSDAAEAIRVLEYLDRLRTDRRSDSEPPAIPEGLSYEAQRHLSVERLRGLPLDLLRHRVDWLNVESRDAYEVLVTDHWQEVEDELRSDLASGFQRIRAASIKQFVETLKLPGTGPEQRAQEDEAAKAIESKLAGGLDAFIRRQLSSAALAGIGLHGTPEDADLVRPFLQDALERRTAISTISRIGSHEDVPALLRVAADSFGETKVEAARAALVLSRNSAETIRCLLQSKDYDLIRLAVDALREAGDESLPIELVRLLNDENSRARVFAAASLAATISRARLAEVLNDYTSQPFYFYDVVAAIDRALYCCLPPQ